MYDNLTQIIDHINNTEYFLYETGIVENRKIYFWIQILNLTTLKMAYQCK